MPQVAYNPDTGEALRFEGESWIKTDVAKNESGAVALWDGEGWKEQAPPESTEKVSERVMSSTASATADSAAGMSKMLGDLPIGKVISSVSKMLGQSPTPLEDSATFWRDVSENARRDYGLDPNRDKLFSSKLISGVGSILPAIASGPAAPLTVAAMMGEQGRKDAEQNEGREFEQDTAFYGNAAVGLVTEFFMGVPAVMRSIRASRLTDASAKAIIGTVAKQAALGSGREALQESTQQASSNLIASSVAQYKKDRDILEGVGDAALVGGIIGGGMSSAFSAANVPAQVAQARAQVGEISDTSLKAALVDADLLEGSPFTKTLIEEELTRRDPGYRAEAAGAPLTAEALRTTSEPQPATEGGETTNETQPVSDPARPVENRDEQRDGLRQRDDGDSQGVQPDESNAASDRPLDQGREDLARGQRDQLATTDPGAVQASSGVETTPLNPDIVSLPEGATGGFKAKSGSATATVIEFPDRLELKDIVSLKQGQGEASAVIESLKGMGKPIELTVGERSGDTPSARLKDFYAKRGFTEVEGRPGRMRFNPSPAPTVPATQTQESTAPAESAPSPQAKAGEASSSQTISDIGAMEARIGQLHKMRQSLPDGPERTKAWEEMQELDLQIRALTDAPPVPPAFRKPTGPSSAEGGFIRLPPRRPPPPAPKGKPPSGGKFLRIPSALSRAVKGQLFVEGTADVLARLDQPVAQELSTAIKKHVDQEQVNFAEAAKPLNDALKGMPKKSQERAFDELETYLRAKENGRTTPTLSFNARKILDAWEETAVITGNAARAAGVKVFDPKLGAYRPMGNLGRAYLPRKFSPEVEQVFRDPENNPALWNSLVQALATHKGITEEAAAVELQADASRFQENDFMGNIEMARGEQLPEIFYDYDLRRIASKYIPAFSERLAQIQAYGQRLGEGRNIVQENLFDKAKKETQDQYSKEWLDQVEQQATNFRVLTGAAKWAERGGMAANALLLSSPTTTVLRNMVSGTIATTELFPANPALKGLMQSLSPDAYRDARELGVIRDNLADSLHADRLGDSPFDEALRTFQNKALKWSGYNGSELFVRTHAAATASQFASDAAQSIATNPNSARSKEALAMFKRLEIEPQEIVNEMGNWRNGPETGKFIRKVIRESQGGYRFDQLPLWANSQAGRFFYKYGRYGVQRSRSLWRNVVLPAFGTEIEVNGKKMRRYDFAPLVKATAGLAITGEIFALASSLLFDRDRRDSSLKEIGEAFKEDEKKAIGMAFERVINDIVTAGTLGIAGQPLDAYKSLKDQSRLKNPFNPPAMSSTNALLQLGMNAVDQGTLTRKDMMNFAGAFAPGVKQLSDVARNAFDEPIYEAEQDVSTLRAAARRWGKQSGMDVASKGGKDRRKSEKAPIFEPIQEALLVGNADLARSLASHYLADSADPKAALRSMTASVRQRMPFRAGPFSSADHVKDFYQWAEKNLPEDQLLRTKRIQERYIRSAQKAGLMRD